MIPTKRTIKKALEAAERRLEELNNTPNYVDSVDDIKYQENIIRIIKIVYHTGNKFEG